MNLRKSRFDRHNSGAESMRYRLGVGNDADVEPERTEKDNVAKT